MAAFRATLQAADAPARVRPPAAARAPHLGGWSSSMVAASLVDELARINAIQLPPTPEEIELCELLSGLAGSHARLFATSPILQFTRTLRRCPSRPCDPLTLDLTLLRLSPWSLALPPPALLAPRR